VYVPDVARALDFYVRAFGLSQRFLHPSGQYGEFETGATALAFADEAISASGDVFIRNRPAEKAAGAEVGLVVSDVQAAFDRAVATGATPVVPPLAKPWGQVVAYVRDLDGFLVELCTEVGS
jgi:lactoylglutathione lyase